MHGARADDAPKASRAFAPEAHLPRNRRLLVDWWGVAVELGIGVQHRLAWADCEAVVRFPDRIELVLTPETSLVVRAGDWYQGDEAVELAYRLAPPALRVHLPGEPEPEVVPYLLTGLSRHTAPLLGTALVACLLIAVMALVAASVNHRWQAVALGTVFLLAALPLLRAIRVRLAVPRRWRQIAAANTSRAGVLLDGRLVRSSVPLLRVIAVAALVLAVALSVLWWQQTGVVLWPVLVLGAAVAGCARHELQRRRGR